jgi:transcriptional regulator with XRE-family HTH domain
MTKPTSAERGQQLVREGQLRELREKLGLTHTAMAAFLYISPATYRAWELGGDRNIWAAKAERLDRFYNSAMRQLTTLERKGRKMEDLMPLQAAASMMGLPQEVLAERYRNKEMKCVDLGILGLWVHRKDFKGE